MPKLPSRKIPKRMKGNPDFILRVFQKQYDITEPKIFDKFISYVGNRNCNFYDVKYAVHLISRYFKTKKFKSVDEITQDFTKLLNDGRIRLSDILDPVLNAVNNNPTVSKKDFYMAPYIGRIVFNIGGEYTENLLGVYIGRAVTKEKLSNSEILDLVEHYGGGILIKTQLGILERLWPKMDEESVQKLLEIVNDNLNSKLKIELEKNAEKIVEMGKTKKAKENIKTFFFNLNPDLGIMPQSLQDILLV